MSVASRGNRIRRRSLRPGPGTGRRGVPDAGRPAGSGLVLRHAIRGGAFLIAVAALLVAGCAGPGGDAGTEGLDVAEAERLVEEQFPESQVEIREVQEVEGTTVAPATLDGSEVEFRFERSEEGWILQAVGREGVVHTVDTLRRNAETMKTMREVAAALSAYREETDSYPAGGTDGVFGELREEGLYGEKATVTDAWGTPFRYRLDAPDYTLSSAGPDGDHGTEDDILLVTGRFVRADGGQG